MLRLVPALLALALSTPTLAEEPPEATSLQGLKSEARARIQDIEQHLDAWDIAAAHRELDELEKLAPPDVEPVHYFRGRVAFEEGRYADAVEQLTKAGLKDKPGSWLQLARDTQRITEDDAVAESAHFILRYPKGRDAVLVPWALDALEKSRAALAQHLGYAPPDKIRVEVLADADELARVSTLSREAIRTTGTIAICKFDKVMIISPRAVIHGYDWLDTLNHEYTHLVVSRKSHNTVPIWLHEGLAKYLETSWRGPAGEAMTPSSLALLGSRVKRNQLVPFAKMYPSMALLPTAEDAATAFAEVFFAVSLIDKEGGPGALARLVSAMADGQSDKAAVEQVTHRSWPQFEKGWMGFLKKQPYPAELVPTSSDEKKELADGKKRPERKGREISFGDFVEVAEPGARRDAHLGELLRERGRMGAAAELYERAWRAVGDRYESVSNKYALTLIELKRYDEAREVLQGSLTMHPGSAQTHVHLGRLALRRHDWAAARDAYLGALAVDPFDEEVHLALFAAARGLKDAPLEARARAAVAVLLDVDPARVGELVDRLFKADDLADVQLPEAAADAGAAPGTR